jgi:2-oxo-3-hexenedioate decarboxylase
MNCLENKSRAQLPSNTIPHFSLSDAYKTALEIKQIRENKKEKASGIKVGFTNKTIWGKYSVNAPIFGFMYSSTILSSEQSFSPEKFLEPKFEPEIFFKLSKKPNSEMSDIDLISCCTSFGIGVELVQSIYKGWTFKLPDTVAGFGLHGQYKILEEIEIPSNERDRVVLIDTLKNFNLTLRKNDSTLEQGKSKNILEESPIAALRSYIEFCEINLDWFVLNGPITTGTITDAYDINKTDVFSCELDHLFEKKFVVKF